MLIVRSDLAPQETPEFLSVKLGPHQFWHGGKFDGGRIRTVLYCSKSLSAALSYVDMAGSRGYSAELQLIEVALDDHRQASLEEIEYYAQQDGIFDEGYTPASYFDKNLYSEESVRTLVEDLMGDEYDHAVLTDVAFGHKEEFDAYVLFPNLRPHIAKRFTVPGEWLKWDRIKTLIPEDQK